MSYKHDLEKLIKKHGRTRKWISGRLGIARITFWRHVNEDTFPKEKKDIIERLIITGK